MNKEINKLVRALEAANFRVKPCGTGHAQVYAPSGEFVTGLASTPSEYRGWANTLARIKRIGGFVYRDGTLTPVDGQTGKEAK
jgi:hypothetical protein